ncbi:hypothetical protein [Nocardiopsis algeriensis]|uniref:Uncharacterized protein n=1 Tax=Nocardiopsis algeriensis TaxID=1478215 RepID=A0A841IXU4_9ACTN|nr:hypothetical protein [Nocardiopsis algeriensis]MBB6121305.1 hypothetical protein [Nocardiopsis algeriensis]
MTVPEESQPKTTDTDQVVETDHSDDPRGGPDVRNELEAELQDRMEEKDLSREDFGKE